VLLLKIARRRRAAPRAGQPAANSEATCRAGEGHKKKVDRSVQSVKYGIEF
jgi:hypothetical protein